MFILKAKINMVVFTEMKRFLAGSTDGRILLIAGGAVEPVIAVCERSVNQVSFTLRTYETFLMPVLVLETHILQMYMRVSPSHNLDCRQYKCMEGG